jgi:hypothetical protein
MKKQLISIILMLAALLSLVGFSASASDGVTLTVSEVTAAPGAEVEVPILLSNNTGLAGLKVSVAYDSVLTLIGVEFNSAISEMMTAPQPYTNPQPIAMISPLDDTTANGVFATLTFKVSETAEAGYKASVSITYEPDDVFDGTFTNVPLTVINGSVSDDAPAIVYGDVNGDGNVNGRDVLLLRKYMANYDYDTETSTVEVHAGADVNGDGTINGRDVLLLRKYMANYDYDTGSSSVVLGPQ